MQEQNFIFFAAMTQKALHMFSRGGDSLVIDLAMHAENRRKVVASLREKTVAGDAVMLQGGGEINMYDSDTVWDFRQESNFQYLFGVKEVGCFGAVVVATGESLLFIPHYPVEYSQWFGPIKPTTWFKDTYLVDAVYYVEELASVMSNQYHIKSFMYYDYENRDSGVILPVPNTFPGSSQFQFLSGPEFAHTINEHRLIKSIAEISILQYTNDVTSRAHIETMKSVWTKQYGRVTEIEHFAESKFRFESALEGCARVGYHCIACSGINNAVLHYGHAGEPNEGEVEKSSLRLLDMGAEYHCYTADITCTFPTCGSFSPDQRAIYESVWSAVQRVESSLKPDVDYRDMHRMAMRTLVEELVARTDLFKTADIDLLHSHHVMSYFCPHGLGHSLGLLVHDVSVLPGEEKVKDDLSIKGLRLQRTLKQNMVITVEPGIYFIEYLIDRLRNHPHLAPLINFDAIERLRKNVGGVRIEDNVVITENGCRVLNDVPREVAEVEKVMRGELEWVVGKMYRSYQ
jgi:Xaa-Pro dipeptidase